MTSTIKNIPRIYTPSKLVLDGMITLDKDQTHYLRHVLRSKESSFVRLFNGIDGEWRGEIVTFKKNETLVRCLECLRLQSAEQALHIYFSPIRKHRQDFLVEKATELGATSIQPLTMQHTQIKGFNQERAEAQVVEAAEQSERLSVPEVKGLLVFDKMLSAWPKNRMLYVGVERRDASRLRPLIDYTKEVAVLVGPEGGFSEEEIRGLEQKDFVQFFSLGSMILRTETALLAAISLIQCDA